MAAVLIFSFLPYYFEKYFALACSFLYAGRPIGTLVFAPLTQVWFLKNLSIYMKLFPHIRTLISLAVSGMGVKGLMLIYIYPNNASVNPYQHLKYKLQHFYRWSQWSQFVTHHTGACRALNKKKKHHIILQYLMSYNRRVSNNYVLTVLSIDIAVWIWMPRDSTTFRSNIFPYNVSWRHLGTSKKPLQTGKRLWIDKDERVRRCFGVGKKVLMLVYYTNVILWTIKNPLKIT